MRKFLLLFILFVTGILAMVASGPEVVYFHSDDFDGPEDTGQAEFSVHLLKPGD